MKAIRWFFLFAAVAVILLGSIIWLNKEAFSTIFSNRGTLALGSEFVPQTYSMAGLVGFSVRHPEYVSIVNEALTDSSKDFYLNEQTPRVYGNLEAIPMAAALEVAGLFSNPVKKDDVMRFVPENLKESEKDVENTEELFCETCSPTIEDVFLSAYQDGNQSAADFLKSELRNQNPDSFAFCDSLGIQRPVDYWTALLQFKSGAPLPAPFNELSPQQKTDLLTQTSVQTMFTFAREQEFYQTLPKAPPIAWTKLLKQLVDGQFGSQEVSGRVTKILKRITVYSKERTEFVDHIGIYHTRLGQLGGAEFGISAFDSTAWVNVVQFDNLPVGLWLHMSSNYMNQDFGQRLTWDPGLRQRLHDTLAVVNKTK